jgi:hypothetical protein
VCQCAVRRRRHAAVPRDADGVCTAAGFAGKGVAAAVRRPVEWLRRRCRRANTGGCMHKLSLIDLGFFLAESAASPKHVGGLMICKRPARSRSAFVADLYQELLTFTDVEAPFNPVIHFSLTGMPDLARCRCGGSRTARFLPPAASAARTGDTISTVWWRSLHQPMLDRLSSPVGTACHRWPQRQALCAVRQDAPRQRRRRDDGALGGGITGLVGRVDLKLRPMWSVARCAAVRKEKRLQGEDDAVAAR